LTILDARSLPALPVLGQASAEVSASAWGNWQPTWPVPGTLVWVGGGFDGWWRWMPWLDVTGPDTRGGAFWPGWSVGGGHLIAFEVAKPKDVKFLSSVDLTTNEWWAFSRAFVDGSRIYLSHQAVEPCSADDPTLGWVQRTYLDVVDYADHAFPTVREPVHIPGVLQGISHAGEMLYTTGIHWTTNQTDWREWLDASSYDGVATHPVDAVSLPDAWPHPVLVVGDCVLVGRPGYSNTSTNVEPDGLEAWRVNLERKAWELAGKAEVSGPASSLIHRDGMVAARDYWASLRLFDVTALPEMRAIGQWVPPGCMWFGLEHATGSLARGLWIPTGLYGVLHVPGETPHPTAPAR
jgi:hypothetical protein